MKDFLFFLVGLSILLLPSILMLGNTAVSKWSDPTPTPTAHPALINACHHPAPNGRFCGANLDGSGVKVSDENGRVLVQEWVKWSHFVGWTEDSQYAFYNLNDQYENSRAVMFDSQNWAMVELGDDVSCWGAGTRGDCRKSVVALAPKSNLVLQGIGRIYDLNHQTEQNLFPNPEQSFIWAAAWSPDESKLAYFGGADKETREIHLYVLEGEMITAVPEYTFAADELYAPNLQWLDNQTIQFEDNVGTTYQYELWRK